MSSQSSFNIPSNVQDMLHIYVVLIGYSSISCGRDMNILYKVHKLLNYVYDNLPTHTSNLDMVVKVLSNYKYFYDEVTAP